MAGPATPAFLVTGASPATCSVQRSVQDMNAVTYRDIASLVGAIYMHIVLIAKQSVRLPANILLNTPCYYSRTKPPTLFLHLQILIAKSEFPGMLSTFVKWVVVM